MIFDRRITSTSFITTSIITSPHRDIFGLRAFQSPPAQPRSSKMQAAGCIGASAKRTTDRGGAGGCRAPAPRGASWRVMTKRTASASVVSTWPGRGPRGPLACVVLVGPFGARVMLVNHIHKYGTTWQSHKTHTLSLGPVVGSQTRVRGSERAPRREARRGGGVHRRVSGRDHSPNGQPTRHAQSASEHMYGTCACE